MGSYPGIEDLPTILLEDVNFYNSSRITLTFRLGSFISVKVVNKLVGF